MTTMTANQPDPAATRAAERADEFVQHLYGSGYDLFTGVPCGILSPLFAALDAASEGFLYAPREDTAVALAAGAWLGGRRPLVVMQNSGLGQSVNALASLIVPYAVPLSMIVSLRGLPPDTTPENQVMGALTEPILDGMGIPARRCGGADDLDWLAETTSARGRPAALLVEPSYFSWSPAR
ncbi:hypothetical protein OHR68_20825 [Spirillospora sp. NBC_00431]